MGIWPFGGEEKGAGAPVGAPVDRVKQLSSQGLSEPEIIRAMKNEGYSPIQVDNAMRNVIKGAVGGPSQPGLPEPQGGQDYPRAPAPSGPPREGPGPAGPSGLDDVGEPPKPPFGDMAGAREPLGMPSLPGERPPESKPQEYKSEEPKFSTAPPALEFAGDIPAEDDEIVPLKSLEKDRSGTREQRRRVIEELIESVVEEKWGQFRTEIGEMQTEFHKIEARLMEFEQTFAQIRGEKKSDIEEIETKLDSYKESINEVSERMESVEQAMKDSLTPMLQSLRSLSDTIKTLKSKD